MSRYFRNVFLDLENWNLCLLKILKSKNEVFNIGVSTFPQKQFHVVTEFYYSMVGPRLAVQPILNINHRKVLLPFVKGSV